jgi:hypothetical protein
MRARFPGPGLKRPLRLRAAADGADRAAEVSAPPVMCKKPVNPLTPESMDKIDFKKELKHLYQPPAKTPVAVEVPAMNYLMVDGEGDPNTAPSYKAAVEALFALSYALKFMVKKSPPGRDYGVLPLEGLWWADDLASFTSGDKSRWKWTMMIMQPDFVTRGMIGQAAAEVDRKKALPALPIIRFESLAEGRSAQILHIGPFSEEHATIEKLHQFISSGGFKAAGKHHEIYLSDIRKADPSQWKTVLRQPMR